MWICMNDGFVSAVRHSKNTLKVRARRKDHLVALLGDAYTIYESKKTDYRFRAFVPQKEFSRIIAERVKSINYDNFKDSVPDDELHNLYADFWLLHYKYQKQRRSTARLKLLRPRETV